MPLLSAPPDYTEEVPTKKRRKKNTPRSGSSKSSSKVIKQKGFGRWTFEGAIESVDVESFSKNDNASFYKMNLYYRPQPDLYVKLGYYFGFADSLNLNENQSRKGNLDFRVVANWLSWSNGAFNSKLDLFGGVSLKENSSNFGSSRTDKMIGFETSRNFSSLIFSLGHEYHMTGKPKNQGELAVGDIRKYYGVLGWKVTPDINFALEAVHYEVAPTSKTGDSLKSKMSSGHLSPWLFLNLSKKFDFILGAVFRTNKIRQEEELRRARLWSYQGLYGNSVFTKINLNI
tara:strand:- start:2802 stop:3662 length:861 start_codon:yes stop_codon:yes gene_type:complete